MLASETQEIANFLKQILINKFGQDSYKEHFADTRDTLCYATNDNQNATYGLLKKDADLAIIVGGYNSSNTTHLVELCKEKLPTYFISNAEKIIDKNNILHFDIDEKVETLTENYLTKFEKPTIVLTCGASCPDILIEQVLHKILGYFEDTIAIEEVLN